MFKFNMTTLITRKDKVHDRWLNDYISPGNVGTIGDVLMDVRLKQSTPDMHMRYLNLTHGKNESRFGSNVQNGTITNFFNFGPANSIDHNWNISRSKKHKIGFKFENLQPPDKTPSMQSVQGALPQFSWHTTTSNVYRALHSGAMFLPAPGPYQPNPGEMPRGGIVPSIVANATQPNVPAAGLPTLLTEGPQPIFGGTLFAPKQ